MRSSPETTGDREGFLHPYRIEGGVAEVTMRILLRDFDTPKLAEQARVAARASPTLSTAEHPGRGDRREGDAAVSQHGRRAGEGAAGR